MVLNFVLNGSSMVPLQASDTLTTASIISNYVVPVVLFLVILVVVYLLGRSVLIPLIARALKQQGHDPAVRSLGENVAGILVWALAIAAAFTVAGFGSVIAAFGVFAGAIVLAIGFAAQDLLANFVAGIFILKDRPFTVGDWIEWRLSE